MSIKEDIKILLAKTDTTLTEVLRRLNEKHKNEFVPTEKEKDFKQDTVQNLSKKINNNMLRYKEAEEIAEVLGYKIEWLKKER